MGTATISRSIQASHVDALHPLCRGEFAAAVFCGEARRLGELAGEPTSRTPRKFVLPDELIDASCDFARQPGMLLPRWPEPVKSPIDGVCFVFTSERHPDLERLCAAGALQDEHYVLLPPPGEAATDAMTLKLARFVKSLPDEGQVLLLGYGHQGSEIARRLRDEFGLDASRILVHEANADSARRAESDEFAIVEPGEEFRRAAGVIYSPLMRHERLHRLHAEARERGLPTLDNSHGASGLRQFAAACGRIVLDGAAARSLRLDGDILSRKFNGLPAGLTAVREDVVRIDETRFPHLHGGHAARLDEERMEARTDGSWTQGPLPGGELRRLFVSTHGRADLGFFAARDLCMRLWPQATRRTFPSEHVVDLGATSFERLLRGHLDAREVGSTMQTPLQRATLAIAASHYAANRPIIEIGSAFGGSALLMAAATDGGARPAIHSIDPEASTRGVMRFAFEREGHADRLHQIIETSDAAIGRLRHLIGGCGLVFIDGLHTFAGVESDYELYAPLVAEGGALAFHDVDPAIEPVMRLVLGRVLHESRFAIRCLADGLAVFERVAG